MRNEQSELHALIELSRIQLEIEKFEVLLEGYQDSTKAKNRRYVIQAEFYDLREELSKVNNHLEDLKSMSRDWERNK